MELTAGARAGSAFIGKTPNNQDDFFIIRGWYRSYGLYTANASDGFLYAAKRPEHAIDESKQTSIIIGMLIVILAIVLPTIGRLVIRLKNNSTRFGSDDWAILVAACLAVVYPCLQISTVINNGAGRHIWESTYADYNTYAYNLGICQLIFFISVGLIKVSITLFVRRLADGASKAWRIFADVFLGTLIIYLAMALFWWVFSCSPPRARWDKWYAGSLTDPAHCGNLVIQARTLSIIHVIQGFILLMSPVIILWHIRINLAKKIRLFTIWLVGGISVLGGLLQQTTTTVTNDNFWEYTVILRWTALDLALGIMVASLPVLDTAIMGTFRSSTNKSAGYSGSHPNPRGGSNRWTGHRGNLVANQAPNNDDTESVEHIMLTTKSANR
ncbi:hypothetical protein PFICI_13571 [Pestalotiopsis fici W106-1]|uniref:Rhodopsin domain-containing protein n=1 Tax=Pestalotiopsis fici (strain W106-1 / CGMCC3.15140) TaxID=1229662 RepID=W3WPK4_PESFW|nr:uncharacterized protein PFICI_13571 [Pestalotiopsis fici W106-1]ETS75087.1 hypothetical protein PFICI_13571 [Pestalotiopsis fici W106-1]